LGGFPPQATPFRAGRDCLHGDILNNRRPTPGLVCSTLGLFRAALQRAGCWPQVIARVRLAP